MSQTILQGNTKKITCDRLPLAIYREIVAHLRQVDGVKADLLEQTSADFDYLQSQVGGLSIEYPNDEIIHDQIESILAHYANKYGNWQVINRWLTICGYL